MPHYLHIALSFALFLLIPVAAYTQGSLGNSKHPIEITADDLVVDQLKHIATFTGNVDATQGDVRLKSHKMDVYYRENTGDHNAISKIYVEGNVFLYTPEETAQGDKGWYNVDKKIIELNNNVVLTKQQNIVKGDHLIYNMTTGKSKMSSKPSTKKKNGRVKGVFVPQ